MCDETCALLDCYFSGFNASGRMAYTEDDIAFCTFVDKRENSWEFRGRSDDFDGGWD
jgi:hypothetical protein